MGFRKPIHVYTVEEGYAQQTSRRRFSSEFSRLIPLSRLTLAISSCHMELAMSLADWVHGFCAPPKPSKAKPNLIQLNLS